MPKIIPKPGFSLLVVSLQVQRPEVRSFTCRSHAAIYTKFLFFRSFLRVFDLQTKGLTVDGSEIRHPPVEVGS